MNFLIFFGVLSVLVLIHELGHFLVALLFGIRVEEFAFGLPFTKALVSVKVRGIKFSLYPLLFGGFVKLFGEEGETEKDKNKSFWGKNKLSRIAVVAAGVCMNLLLALVAFGFLYGVVGVPQVVKQKVTVLQTLPETPAERAGIKAQDRIVAVEGKEISDVKEFSDLMKSWAGLGVNLTIERGEGIQLFEGLAEQKTQRFVVNLIPRVNPPKDQGALGVAISDFTYLEMQPCDGWTATCLVNIVKQGFSTTYIWIARVVDGFRMIGQNLSRGEVPQDVSGPVGIYKLTGVVAGYGFWPLVELTAILSVNLAVFNILPIPALDGGRVLFIILEWIRGKRMSADFEQKINSWGMMALLVLIALVTLQDLWHTNLFSKLLGK